MSRALLVTAGWEVLLEVEASHWQLVMVQVLAALAVLVWGLARGPQTIYAVRTTWLRSRVLYKKGNNALRAGGCLDVRRAVYAW